MKKQFIRRLLLGLCVPLTLSAQTTISNVTYGAGQNITVESTSSIVAGANVTVASGANVTYQSTTTTTLSPGFTAATGSSFHVKVRDTDGDGMSDWWEVLYGFNPNSGADAALDPDGDGVSNLNEFLAGTNPLSGGAGGGTLPPGWATDVANPDQAVGATAGQLSVDKSGALNYSIPLWTTPGTAGMEPKISLNYSSQSGPGIAGFGWSLGGVSAITRGPQSKSIDGKNKGVTLTADDRFYLDGQRLVYVGGGTGYGTPGSEYRTELDSITKVVANGTAGSGPAWFKVWTKAGLVIEFGHTADSAFDAAAGGVKVSWSVNKISDTKGNYIAFSYDKILDGAMGVGTQVLARIDYTGNGTGAPYASLRFTYEDRPDWVKGYVAGTPVSSTKRLKTVQSRFGEAETGIARTYTLNYRVNTVPQEQHLDRSVLESLVEAGSDGKAYPPLTFEYAPNDYGWAEKNSYIPPYFLADNQTDRPTGAGTGFVDLNGDGLPDFVVARDSTASIHINNGDGWTEQSAYGYNFTLPFPLATFTDTITDTGARFADVNGDGRVDYLYRKHGSDGSEQQNKAWINTGTGWQDGTSTWQVPAPIARDGTQNDDPLRSGRFLDVNGDGRVDFVTYMTTGAPPNNTASLAVYLNNGNGWDNSPGYSYMTDNLAKYKARFVDINGDGLPDIVAYYANGGDVLRKTWLNTGTGWTPAPAAYLLPVVIGSNDSNNPGVEFADVNGDGLPDIIWYREYASGQQKRGVAINTGAGWLVGTQEGANIDPEGYPIESDPLLVYYYQHYAPPSPLARDGTEVSAGTTLTDLNADGIPDYAYKRIFSTGASQSLYYGTLRHFGYDGPNAPHNLPEFLRIQGQKNAGVDFPDLNADGVPDMVVFRKNTGSNETKGVWLNKSKPTANRLVRVTNGFGVAVDVAYASLMDPQVYTKAADNSDLPAADQDKVVNVIGPMYVVRSVNNDNGAGGTHSLVYSYARLRTHLDYGSLGFGWTKIHDTARDIRTQITYRQDYPFVGQASYVKVTRVSDAGPLLSETTTTWAKKPLNTGAPYPTQLLYASSVVQKAYDLGTQVNYLTTTTTTAEPDIYGNIGSMSVNTSDGFGKATTNTYKAADTENWILGRLETSEVESTVTATNESVTRHSAFTYYSDGLLESETVEPDNDTLRLKTTYLYDPFGNKTSVEVRGKSLTVADNGSYIVGSDEWRTTTTEYDPNGRFPIWTRNAATHTEDYGYDQVRGVVTTLVGANDLTTTWTYDGFGRKTGEARADGTQSAIRYQWTPAGYLADSKYFIESETTGSAPARTHHDKFGRARWSQTVGGIGQMVLQETRYDSLGRVAQASVPYFNGSSDVYWSSTTYDLLDRPHTTTTPDDENGPQTVFYDYNAFTATATDPKGRVSETVKNSQGSTLSNIRNRDAGIGASDYSKVTYTYDALGNLKSTNAAEAVTSLSYDLRGRKETMTDADMGTWLYRYNIFGELIWQKDAKLQIVRLSYDNLGRLITRVESEGTTSWTYDSTSAGPAWKGKLYSVAAPGNYAETYLYDSLGRPAKVTRTIDSTSYDFETAYDGAGRPNRLKYPATGLGSSPFSTRNVYNQYGYLKEIRHWLDSDTDGNTANVSRTIAQPTGKLYWKADSYHVSGRVDGEIAGNGVASDRFYSAATGRLLAASVDLANIISPPYQIQQLIYQYDAVGNVKRRHDAAPGVNRDERFYNSDPADGYDGLDRLKVHRIIGGATVTVGYDQMGNIQSKSDVGSYAYSGVNAGPHAVTTAGVKTYQYDANGNMYFGGGRTVEWTSFNQARKITDDATGKNSEFFFGAGHERVKQLRKNGTTLIDTTLYIGSAYEKVTTAAGGLVEHKHYIMASTGRVAVFTDRSDLTKDTRYFHSDGLGSITVVTDESGVVLKRYAYDAWGKQSTLYTNTGGGITNQAPTTRGFTDHEQLSDLGLVHMNGRVYDPVLGRFLSADPNIDDASDAQGFNRYSYVGNNPMNATDPSGYFKFWKDFLGPIVQQVATVVGYIYGGPLGASFASAVVGATINGTNGAIQGGISGLTFGFTNGNMVATAFASSFSGSLLNGGSIGDAFKAGVISAGAAYITPRITNDPYLRIVAQGVINGLAEEAMGGSFRHGFVSGIANAVGAAAFQYGMQKAVAGFQRTDPQADVSDPSAPPTSAPQGHPMGAAGRAQVLDAVKEATTMVDKAITDVRGVIASGKASPEYQDYFGNFDAVRAQSVLTVLESVKAELQNSKLVFNSILRSNPQYLWGSGGQDNVIAWVRQSNPHVVNLQSSWWASGLLGRAGTIIHELTHLVGGTDDHGYNSSILINWAQTSPMSAVKNANSYKYYAISLP